MRRLRTLGAILFYVAFPVALVSGGLDAFARYESERRETRAFEEMERRLKALKDEIVLESDRPRLFREAVAALAALPDLDSTAVDLVARRFEASHPGLLKWNVFRARASSPVELVRSDVGRNREFLELSAHYLLVPEHEARFGIPLLPCEPPPGKMSDTYTKRINVVGTLLFGNTVTLRYMERRSGEFFDVRAGGRVPAKFAWTPLFRGSARTPEALAGLLMLFVDDAAYRESHSPGRLAARAAADARASGIRIAAAAGDAAAADLLARLDPALPGRPLAGVESARLRGEVALAFALQARRGDPLRLVASTGRHGADGGLRLALTAARVLVAAVAIVAALFLLLVGSGRARPFIPVRFRLVALFLFAALPPLAVIAVFGFRYLAAREAMLEKEALERIDDRIRQVDEEIRRDIAGLRTLCNEVARYPEILGRRSTAELDLPGFERRLGGLIAAERLDFWGVLGADGAYLARRDKYHDHPLLATIVPRIVPVIVRFTNDPDCRIDFQGIATADDSISRLFFANRYDFADQMVRNVGEIHTFKFMNWNYSFFLHPIVDPARRAYAALCLVVDLHLVQYGTLRRLASGPPAEPGAPFLAVAGLTERHRKCPAALVDGSDELRRLIEQVAADRIPASARLRLAGTGESEVIAVVSPLRETDAYLVAGMVPMRAIRDELALSLRLFVALLLGVAALAAVVGAGLARALIRPVRALREGVAAVAAGRLSHRVTVESNDEFGELSATFNGMVGGLQEKERMSRYVSEFVRDAVKRDDGHAAPLGERRKGTILFSDLRDFTTLSELHPPEEIVRLLNAYLEAMTVEIIRHGGVVDKFIGDAVMAVFYPPAGAETGDERAAVEAALAMRGALEKFNIERKASGRFEVENGIGLNTGQVIQGAIGSRAHRVDLTVIGDAVNIAARLESVSKEGRATRIILSDSTWAAVTDLVECRDMGEIAVKGKGEPLRVREIVRRRPGKGEAAGR